MSFYGTPAERMRADQEFEDMLRYITKKHNSHKIEETFDTKKIGERLVKCQTIKIS
jgi:hypothetical protein